MSVPAGWPSSLASRLADGCDPSGLGARPFAYLTPPEEHIGGDSRCWKHRFFHALGATSLSGSDEETRAAIADYLRGAEWMTARDDFSMSALRGTGVSQTSFAWDAGALEPVLTSGSGGITSLARLDPPREGRPLLVQASAKFLRENHTHLAGQIAAIAKHFTGVRIALAGGAALP